MKILVTSGSSYLGGRIADFFQKEGYDITVGLRHKSDKNDASLNRFKKVLINWNSIASLKRAVAKNNVIIHTAGLSSKECQANPNLAFEFNSLKSGLLGVACQYEKVDLFINLSSIHVYSKDLNEVISEDSATENIDIYSRNKKLTENIFKEISIINQTKFINLRLSNVFGFPINNNQTCWELFVNNICKSAIERKLIKVKSNPLQNRNFISMSLLNRALKHILDNKKELNYYEIFNITSNKSMTLEEVALLIRNGYQEIFSKEINIVFNSKKINCKKKSYSSRLNNFSNFDKEFDCEIKELILYCKNKFG